ncbi:AmpG family muropeptide MFS transporter [Longimicrobium sp.]|uniref:AmpG family muropeptide MFS transporter n=1 Tax=Longimicrobium sp. TaxID=2029185 RepID=UPI002E378C1A|nr:AmpG family muropeptide MFS transporter [Longimicrobium sp.]HEX6040519.1 AmpG family muropeptide MFS transporter [Longimicrobium sp.]
MNHEPRSAPSLFRVFGQRKMAALLFLGFSSGLPLYLTSSTLQAWMTVEKVDLTTVGMVSLLSVPYSLKFIIAPLMDRYVPFLGRRRGWLVITQVALLLCIAAMSLHDPRRGLQLLAINALLIAFFSAAQDVVVDAYSVDVLEEREMGAGASLKVMGYRLALIITGGVALMLADRMSWPTVYLLMAALMLVGVAASILAPEPVLREGPPSSLASAVVEPFLDFLRRAGVGTALVLLLFVVLYSLSDRMVQNMTVPFLLARGYSQSTIGEIRGVIGLVATIVGVLAGGGLVARLGINRSLWILAAIQMGSNLAYYWLSVSPSSRASLTTAIVVENFSGGLVTAGFVAFLMSLCSKQFSATQYALLSSFMAFARDVLVAPSGGLAAQTGWPQFFLITIAAGIPALLLLPYVAPWNRENPRGAAAHTGEVTDAPPADADDHPFGRV